MKKLVALLLGFSAASSVHAQGALPLSLLSKPLHIGDTVQKDMANPKPDATKYQASFQWNGTGVGELFLIINASHLVPKNRPEFQKGFYQTAVMVNGQDLGILNKLVRSQVESPKAETLVMPLKAAVLRQGENVLLIQPGGKDGDLDDIELLSISIDSKRPR